jgi:hypothetical protein
MNLFFNIWDRRIELGSSLLVNEENVTPLNSNTTYIYARLNKRYKILQTIIHLPLTSDGVGPLDSAAAERRAMKRNSPISGSALA